MRAVGLLCLLLTLSGCAYLKAAIGLGPTRPKVNVVAVEVSRATLIALDLIVTIRVDNPNDFNLDFSMLKYQMTAGELNIAAGSYDPPLSVPAEGHALVKLPLTVDAGNVIKLAQEMLQGKEEVTALMKATADFATPVGNMTVDFEDKRPLRQIIKM
jgi:LEA14-like dessication related protein